jgi:RNA polymerase sigma-70 factor (ECF subfamily)
MQRDDERALAELVHAYTRPLHATATMLLGGREGAQDILQDVFIAYWDRRMDIRSDENVGGYLHRAVRNRTVDFLRHERTQQRLADNLMMIPDMPTVAVNAAERTLEEDDVRKQLIVALQHVPPSPRRVFMLSYKDGLTYQEISAALGVSVETVRRQIYRATQRLAAQFLDSRRKGS